MSQSEEDRSESSQGFKIEDRRRFSETGDSREGAPDKPDKPEEIADATADATEHAAEGSAAHEQREPLREPSTREPGEHPPSGINFSSFVFGLATQAMMFMGLAPDPSTGMVHRDLGQAKSLVDILAMLAEKTRGNLDEEEDTMMEEMLYELRMQYVRILRGDTEPPQSGENG